MIREVEIVVSPDHINQPERIQEIIIQTYHFQKKELKGHTVLKRSIDARGRKVVYRMKVAVYLNEPIVTATHFTKYQNVSTAEPVIVVGAGPAGMFAALRLIELGLKPVVIERGKDVKQRRRDLAKINKEGLVNPESNYCFGEGGAGTYSDGKLYTRSNKRGDVNKMLGIFVQHGAPEDILVDARPHIGTNKLPHIISAIRQTILESGGEFYFDTRLQDILTVNSSIKAAVTSKGTIPAKAMILATGHSARDIYTLFREKSWFLEAKPFALGVRIEHPQEVIDKAQYHCEIRHSNLPPSYYSLVEQVGKKGVFSFCMCPGGIIAPCATDENEIVVNGWSPSKRNNPFANSGTVVQIELADVKGAEEDPFKLLNFQAAVEKAAFEAGGGYLKAPAQRMVDFVEERFSGNLPENSYLPGLTSANLYDVLPDFVAQSLKSALPRFGQKMKGYFTNEAVLVGVESRTSSPVRIPRNRETLQHPEVKGLFPCAEGAGYAGGIISAAIDGQACADAVYQFLKY